VFKTEKISETTIVIYTSKSLDNSNAHEMTAALSEAQEAGYRYIIIDMRELEFLSSAGVGSILGVLGRSREDGGDIILCNVRDRILHILGVLDLCDFLTIKQDESAAREFCLAKDV